MKMSMFEYQKTHGVHSLDKDFNNLHAFVSTQ